MSFLISPYPKIGYFILQYFPQKSKCSFGVDTPKNTCFLKQADLIGFRHIAECAEGFQLFNNRL